MVHFEPFVLELRIVINRRMGISSEKKKEEEQKKKVINRPIEPLNTFNG